MSLIRFTLLATGGLSSITPSSIKNLSPASRENERSPSRKTSSSLATPDHSILFKLRHIRQFNSFLKHDKRHSPLMFQIHYLPTVGSRKIARETCQQLGLTDYRISIENFETPFSLKAVSYWRVESYTLLCTKTNTPALLTNLILVLIFSFQNCVLKLMYNPPRLLLDPEDKSA